MTRMAIVVLAGLLSSGVLGAQGFTPSANPVSDAVRARLDRDSKDLVAAAELMPADRYSYHPTPAQMTFGNLIAHIVQTNLGLCGYLAPNPPSPEIVKLVQSVSDAQPKDALVGAIRQSFEYCTTALAQSSDAHLADEPQVFGRGAGNSRAALMITLVADWADHYSTAAGYLRLNGVLPASAKSVR